MPAAPSSPCRARGRASARRQPRGSSDVEERSISQGSEHYDATKAKRVSFGRAEETHEGTRLTGQDGWRAFRKRLEAKQRAQDREEDRAEEQRVKGRKQGAQTKQYGREKRVKEESDEGEDDGAQAQWAVATQRLRTWVADTAHRSWPRKRLRGEDIDEEEAEDDGQGVTEGNPGPSASEMAGAAKRLFLYPEPLDTRESLNQRERDLETLRLYLPRLETNMQQVRSVMEHHGEW